MRVIRIKNFYLPYDTQLIIPKEIKEDSLDMYNFALLYNLPNTNNNKNEIKINEDLQHYRWNIQFVEKILNRFQRSISLLEKQGYLTESFEAILQWRMIIGLGASHPQETSITLHPIYGIPYIPGSAVKGVTRHWVILRYFDNKEIEAEKDTQFVDIFGTQNCKGKVIFFDAYPSEQIRLKLDIMNPHYPDYYSKGEPPTDWQNPRPIKFLTVEKTKFNFSLASRSKLTLERAIEWLKEALSEYGIGAKTSLGYGIFEHQ